jgi:hypothetical protein
MCSRPTVSSQTCVPWGLLLESLGLKIWPSCGGMHHAYSGSANRIDKASVEAAFCEPDTATLLLRRGPGAAPERSAVHHTPEALDAHPHAVSGQARGRFRLVDMVSGCSTGHSCCPRVGPHTSNPAPHRPLAPIRFLTAVKPRDPRPWRSPRQHSHGTSPTLPPTTRRAYAALPAADGSHKVEVARRGLLLKAAWSSRHVHRRHCPYGRKRVVVTTLPKSSSRSPRKEGHLPIPCYRPRGAQSWSMAGLYLLPFAGTAPEG